MALSHTVYFFFGSLDFAQEYVKTHAPEMRPVVSVYDVFSIDDARALRSKLSEYADEKVVSIVRIEKITVPECQGVLLKICEELSHTHVFFSFSPRIVIFDTLLSRGVVMHEEVLSFHFDKKIGDAFYKGTFDERMKIFEKLTKEDPDAEPRVIVSHMIEDLVLLQDKTQAQVNGPIFLDALKLLTYQKASPKQIFEYIALLVKK